MNINRVYSITAEPDNSLMLDVEFSGVEGVERVIFAYRSSDTYSPLTDIVSQWLVENPSHEILPYVPPLEPTQEEVREQMPPLTPRQFRDALIDEDIMPDQVTSAIGQIPDAKQRAKVLNAWEYPTQFTRTDPLIDQIGAMFDLSPEEIDVMWESASK